MNYFIRVNSDVESTQSCETHNSGNKNKSPYVVLLPPKYFPKISTVKYSNATSTVFSK